MSYAYTLGFFKQSQMSTRIMTPSMVNVSIAVLSEARKSYPNLEPFNHVSFLLFHSENRHAKNCKARNTISLHTDSVYNHRGEYMSSLNSQKKGTPTAVLTIGDSRNFEIWISKFVQKSSGRYGKDRHGKCYKKIVLSHGTLFLLNHHDEKPCNRVFLNELVEKSYFIHGHSKVIKLGGLSIAMIFRVTTHTALVNRWTGSHYFPDAEMQKIIEKNVENNFLLMDFEHKKDFQRAFNNFLYDSFLRFQKTYQF